ncbi:hypothetical protein AMAG_15720 [Allomyces macrogynus ATCC 38327]|uniref:Uncharacterized protein n=1 Tax=Allomyces macrogynus (strain ATCC 38327) TaxID=578462 RepID=A0A0L0T9P5_ALLM3|nr:hypothetical protein AMAG_15720 [Allomyces macrogynus ATCC 38327]|eukprot:KNE71503.1 hypothetical protein AMAG_15720 [Allomyces macrogynus ATCC 38327]
MAPPAPPPTGATAPLLKPAAKPPPWPTRAAARLRAVRTAVVTRIPWFWLLKLVISLVLALAVFGAAYKVLVLPAPAAQGMGAAAGVLCLVTLVVHEWRAHRDHDAAEAHKRLLEDAHKARAHDAETSRAVATTAAAAALTTPSMPAPAQNSSFGGTESPSAGGTIDRSTSSAYNTSTRSGGGSGPLTPAEAAPTAHRMSLTVHLSPNSTATRIRPPSTPSLGSVADGADAGGGRHATSSSHASSSMEASAAALTSSAGTSQVYSRSPSSVADSGSGGAGSDGVVGVPSSGIQITAPDAAPWTGR